MKTTIYRNNSETIYFEKPEAAVKRTKHFIQLTEGDIIVNVRHSRISLFADKSGAELTFSVDRINTPQVVELNWLRNELSTVWISQGMQRSSSGLRNFILQGEAVDVSADAACVDSIRPETDETDNGFQAQLGRLNAEKFARDNSPEQLAAADSGWIALEASLPDSDVIPKSNRIAA